MNILALVLVGLVAGIYGGLTAKIKIIFVQGLPALLALLAINFLYVKGN